jgi:hypothetical protein
MDNANNQNVDEPEKTVSPNKKTLKGFIGVQGVLACYGT